MKYSFAFIIFPGGFGTLDELFETLTLIQTKKIENFPVVIFGKEYWQPLFEMMKIMTAEGTILQEDEELVFLTDSVKDAIGFIEKHTFEKFEIHKRRVVRPISVFFEKPLSGKRKSEFATT